MLGFKMSVISTSAVLSLTKFSLIGTPKAWKNFSLIYPNAEGVIDNEFLGKRATYVVSAGGVFENKVYNASIDFFCLAIYIIAIID